MAEPHTSKPIQAGFIAGGAIVILAVSGYFVGLRQTQSAISQTRPVEIVRSESRRDLTGVTDAPIAVSYIDQDWSAQGANAKWHSSFAEFTAAPPPAGASKSPSTPDNRREALIARATRRAFDGAPPVVPHPVTQNSSTACLACHGSGLMVKDRFASKISHPDYGGSCTQCHVSSVNTLPAAAEFATLSAPLTENTFTGRESPAYGLRAWSGAPPTIPHRTLMRDDCMSCHGPHSLFALRTPHPERQSCTQCHVPSAAEDQRLFLNAPALGATPLTAPTRPAAPKP